MRKLLILIMILTIISGYSFTAYASEDGLDDAGGQGSEMSEPEQPAEPEQPEAPAEPEQPETPSEPEEPETPSEPSEIPSEPSDTPEQPEAPEQPENAGETISETEIPTVNISKESIEQIVTALNVSDESVSLSFKDGTVYTIIDDSSYDDIDFMPNLLEAFETYRYVCLYHSSAGSAFYLNFFNSEPVLEFSSSGYNFRNGPRSARYYGKFDSSTNTLKVRKNIGMVSNVDIINFNNKVWSNFHLVDTEGNLIHESDVVQTYIINFESGFEDLVINTMSSINFNAPVPQYDGFNFDGWYLDSDFVTPYTADYIFTQDSTLYAKWIPYKTITIVSPFDDYIFEPIIILQGETYNLPLFEYPDYEFMGAYTTADYQNNTQFLTGSIIDDDITLYLKFEQINYAQLFTNLLDRTEGLIYVQIASLVMSCACLLFIVFFNNRHRTGI